MMIRQYLWRILFRLKHHVMGRIQQRLIWNRRWILYRITGGIRVVILPTILVFCLTISFMALRATRFIPTLFTGLKIKPYRMTGEDVQTNSTVFLQRNSGFNTPLLVQVKIQKICTGTLPSGGMIHPAVRSITPSLG